VFSAEMDDALQLAGCCSTTQPELLIAEGLATFSQLLL
jgi:hypothetical protein